MVTTYHLIANDLVAGTVEREAAVAAAKAEHRREVEALRTELRTAKPARRKRKVSLANALRQAKKAGQAVAGAPVTADGVTLTFGQPGATKPTDENPWDQVLDHERH